MDTKLTLGGGLMAIGHHAGQGADSKTRRLGALQKNRQGKVTIIDYGVGNVFSVSRAFQHVEAEVIIASSASQLENAEYSPTACRN